MREFLVRIDIDTGALEAAEVSRLRAAEGRRALQLAEDGSLRALWRVPGRWANMGLWVATDRAQLMEILATLPLSPFMTIDIQELDAHPSDPRRNQHARAIATHTLPPLPELTVRSRSDSSGIPSRAARRQPELPELPVLRVQTRRSPSPISPPTDDGMPASVVVAMDVDVTLALEAVPHPSDLAAHAAVENALSELQLPDRSVRAPDIAVTHSGERGVDRASVSGCTYGTVDVGRVRRVAVVRPLPSGEESIQIRSITTLTLTGGGSLTLDTAAQILKHVEARLRTHASIMQPESAA